MDNDSTKPQNGEAVEKKKNQRVSHGRFNLRQLDEVDRHILQLKLENPAITMAEIGDKVGMKKGRVFVRLKNPVFVNALYELQLDTIEILHRAKQKAARRLTELIRAKSEMVSFLTCKALLEAELPATKHEFNGSFTHRHKITDAEIDNRVEDIIHSAGINNGADKAITELLTKAGVGRASGVETPAT